MPCNATDFPIEKVGKQGATVRVLASLMVGSSSEFLSVITGEINGGVRRLRIDLSQMEWIDNSGAEALEEIQRHLKRRGGELTIVSPNEQVMGIFNGRSLTHFFDKIEP